MHLYTRRCIYVFTYVRNSMKYACVLLIFLIVGQVKGVVDFVGAQATATMGLQILTAAGQPAFTEDGEYHCFN